MLDWTCLPDPSALDPTAPRHDSCTGWFVADRFRRTWREIAGTPPAHVPFNESLYAPRDEHGASLPTINEAVHRSAIARYGRQALLCSDDASGAAEPETWTPTNMGALIDGGRPRPGITVVD